MDTSACRFCQLVKKGAVERVGTVGLFLDGYPVTEGHTLIIPLEHRPTFFDLTEQERRDVNRALDMLESRFTAKGVADFNIGWNAGELAGQTVPHAHCHLIPRRPGDMEDPTGGVRGVIPEKQKYVRRS